MLSNSIWGSKTWNLLHSLVENIKDEDFYTYKRDLILIITNICFFLPCCFSSRNSKMFFASINPKNLNNLNDIRGMLFAFHNFINKQINKSMYNYSDIIKYKYVDITLIHKDFVEIYTSNNIMQNNNIIKELDNFIFNNIYAYIKIPEPIKETLLLEKCSNESCEQLTKLNIGVKEENNFTEKSEIIIHPIFKSNIYKNISIIDDNNLPSVDISLSEAMLIMMQNPLCVPYKVYVERWKNLKQRDDKKKNIVMGEIIKIDDSLLPPLNNTLPAAIELIKKNPKCVPNDLYIKRWNELKTFATFNRKNKIRYGI